MALRDWLLPAASPEAFARRVVRAMHKAGVGDGVQVFLGGERVAGPAAGEHRVHLDNVYADYRNSSRRERGRAVDVIVQMALLSRDKAALPADARERLLPLVRDGFFFAQLDPLGGDPTKRPVTRPLNDELACGLCIDHDNGIATVNADELVALGLSEDEAYALARANLERRSDAPFESPRPGLFASNFGDYHDSGRLTMPELFARLDVRGDVVIAVPNRTSVLACGSQDAVMLHLICAFALEQITTQPRPISGTLFRLENFEWRPWMPPRSNEAWPAARKLWLTARAQAYADQQQVLSAALEKAGIDRFVASYAVVEQKGDEASAVTWCAWPAAVTDGSLPVTDLVAVGDDPKDAKFATWADVMRVAGHRLTPDPCGWPPRFRFTTAPSAEEIAAIPALELDAAVARLRAAEE